MVSKVDGGEVEVVVVVHVDDNLAHSRGQATMERFAVELKRKFKLKDMDDDNYYARVPTLSKADGPGGGRIDVKVFVPGSSGGAHVDGNDDTAGHCVRGTRWGQIL